MPNHRIVVDERYELDPGSRRAGGMGEIWFGFDKRLNRPIAMKFIHFQHGRPGPELTRRFVREARVMARLDHPGVPAIYDCGTHGNDLFLVMQLIKGRSIADILDESGPLPVPWAAAVAAQACAVLAAAHARSLVHRDLKPGNLMLCRDGSVKVLDFGLAAVLSPEATKLTRTGFVVGTPEYMAPEQASSGRTGPRSDLYSLGLVLDEMLNGPRQPAGATAPPSQAPDELDRLVARMLATEPGDRPSSAAEVYGVLARFCHDLPPLPRYVDAAAFDPTRAYASVLGRVHPSSGGMYVTDPP